MTIKILSEKLLSANWGTLSQVSYEFPLPNGSTEVHEREVYDRGDGAVILLYHAQRKTLILTRQFRLPVWKNKHPTGMLIEAAAGKVEEGEEPLDCVLREALEETGIRISSPTKIFSAYMSPGSVTELIHFYLSSFEDHQRVTSGGGQRDEQESIEVMEIPFHKALGMISSGEIQDAKTIMLIQQLALLGIF